MVALRAPKSIENELGVPRNGYAYSLNYWSGKEVDHLGKSGLGSGPERGFAWPGRLGPPVGDPFETSF